MNSNYINPTGFVWESAYPSYTYAMRYPIKPEIIRCEYCECWSDVRDKEGNLISRCKECGAPLNHAPK